MHVTIFSKNDDLKKDIEAYTNSIKIVQDSDLQKIFQEMLFSKPDVLIIDCSDEKILELYTKIKKDSSFENLKILFILEKFELTFFQKIGFNIGDVDYIKKPVELNQLISKLNSYNHLLNIQDKIINVDDFVTQYSQSVIKGEMIGIISHQWKQPLNIIATSVINLELKSELEQLEHGDIAKGAEKIHTTLERITGMIHNFERIFQNSTIKTDFNINEAVLKSLQLISPQLNSHKIKITNNMNKNDFSTINFENELCQAILCLFSIIKDSIIKRYSDDKSFHGNIALHINKESDKLSIMLVNQKIEMSNDSFNHSMSLNSLFMSSPSDKNTKLYIAKKIIENKLNGNLSIINDTKDVTFNITL